MTGPSLFQYNTRNGRRRTPLEAFLFHSKFEKEEDEKRRQVSPAVSVVFHARVVKILFEEVKSSSPDICTRGGLDVCPLVKQSGSRSRRAGGPVVRTLRATGLLVVDGRLCNAEKWDAEQCRVYEGNYCMQPRWKYTGGTTSSRLADKEGPLARIEAYASALHTKLSVELQGEEGESDLSRKKSREGPRDRPQLVIKTANARRGCELSTIWQYLAQDAGLLTSPGLPDVNYMTSRLNTPRWFPFFVGSPDKWGGSPDAPHLHGIVMMPVLLHPRSRGSVTIRKREESGSPVSGPLVNPLQPPQIDPRYLSSERDVEALVKGQ
ncbi:hypothetical protein Emag_003796 [Eimeria magna]